MDPASQLSRKEHAQGSQLLRWYQNLLPLVTERCDLSCGAQKALAAAPGLLKPCCFWEQGKGAV